jgi:hypothetical protein
MSTLRTALVLGWLLSAVLAAQEPIQFSPQAGVLLLRNGQLMPGEITPAGDQYIVTFGVGGEVKISAKDVEARCADLEGVYDYKLRRLSGEGAGPHLDLAEWCLRQKLYRRCAEQLTLALAEDPENKRIAQIESRLQLAVEAPATTKSKPVNSTIVAPEQLEKTIRDLPKGSLERFTTIVQPMLNNRCATSHCHGATSTSDFRLLRPPSGLNAPQLFTQRNLYASLAYVDRQDAESSLLLTKAQEPHGGEKSPPIDPRNKAQLQELRTWLEHLAPRKEPPAPATIDAKTTQLSTPLHAVPGNREFNPSSPADKPREPGSGKTPSPTASVPAGPAATTIPADSKPWQPRDPFDPEIFNRRHGKR